jgi:hypothetical protein
MLVGMALPGQIALAHAVNGAEQTSPASGAQQEGMTIYET